MTDYFDLHLSNASIAKQAQALGFAETFSPKTIVLTKPKDVPNKHCEFCVIESENGSLLVEACKRGGSCLINPLRYQHFYKDDELMAAAKDKGKTFEIPLRPLLHSSFVHRAKALNQIRFFLRRCIKRRVGFVITSRAESEYDLKSPRELMAIASVLGLSREQADYALSKAAEKLSEDFG